MPSQAKQKPSVPPKVGGPGGLPLARLIVSMLTLLVLAACGSTNQLPTPVNPDTLPAELGESGDLPDAVDEFSVRLGLDPANVIVRIQFRGCETCEIRQPPKQPPDLSPDEAQEELQPNDKLWLVAQDVTCYYIFDGKTVAPLSCQQETTSEGATP